MRAQMEIIGLVFIVFIMVLAVAIFLGFSGTDTTPRNIQDADNYGKSLEAAMLETTIPSCGYDLATALDRCVTQSFLTCGFESVCDAAQEVWEEMLEASLQRPAVAYVELNNQKIDGFSYDPGTCEGPNRFAAPSQLLQTNAGQLRFTIEFC